MDAPPPPPFSTCGCESSDGRRRGPQSKRARAQQDAERVDKDESNAIRIAGGKTFYLRDGVWTDADFKAGTTLPETAVKFGSDEYFALLKQKSRLAASSRWGESRGHP